MLKAKKLFYVVSLGLLAAGGCCLPALPLCNECVFGAIEALAALASIGQGQAV